MKLTFGSCAVLKELPDLSKWDTYNVEDMSLMFYGCESLKEKPPFDKWDHTYLISADGIFEKCKFESE